MSRLALGAVLCAVATAAVVTDQSHGSLRTGSRAQGFVHAMEFKHKLRVCNAYPYSAALDVFRGRSEKLTQDAPMHYKTCKDFVAPLKSGDKLEFKVAVIDTFKGAAKSSFQIMDVAAKGKTSRSEELRYDSVVAINPGVYEVELMGSDGKAMAKSQLVALNQESYVIMRTGVEAQQGPAYAQDLLVYPNSDPAALHSSAPVVAKTLAASVMLVLGATHWW